MLGCGGWGLQAILSILRLLLSLVAQWHTSILPALVVS